MSAPELLRTIISRLEAAEIPYMLTGSLAAAVHGAGRATLDIDLVIEATAEQLRSLVGSLATPDLYARVVLPKETSTVPIWMTGSTDSDCRRSGAPR